MPTKTAAVTEGAITKDVGKDSASGVGVGAGDFLDKSIVKESLSCASRHSL